MKRLSSKSGLGLASLAIACVAGGLIALSVASAQGPAVAVRSTATTVGLQGKVALRALDIASPGLGAWTIDVSYDREHVNVAGCAPEQNGICNPAFGEHTVRVTGTNLGLIGDTTLASIVFGCKQVGSSELTVSVSVLADATIGGPRPIAAAVENGKITCLEAGVPTPMPETPKLKGDVNCDGLANAIDAALVLQLNAGLVAGLLCEEHSGDLNSDGEINSIDAAIILQIDAGLA